MFGSVVLDVALGLVLTFLLFSLILTSAQEGIESALKGRAKDLERAIGELLDKGAKSGIVKQFYEHPLIFPLFKGPYKERGGNLPSYIPKENFAAAVADIAATHAALVAQTPPPAVAPSQQLVTAVRIANQLTGGGTATAIQGLEAWYESAMERLSGQYKRKTQKWLFGLGVVVAVLGNINPITIAEQVASDQKLRTAVAVLATEVQGQVKRNDDTQEGSSKAAESGPKENAAQPQKEGAKPDNKEAHGGNPGEEDHKKTGSGETKNADGISHDVSDKIRKQLEAGLPVGWGKYPTVVHAIGDKEWRDRFFWQEGPKLVTGWLIAALAGMLGAPFWFDQLNRIMNLRAALKPEAKK